MAISTSRMRSPTEPSAAIAETHAIGQNPPGAWVQTGTGDVALHGSPELPFTFIVPDSLTALQQVAAYWRSQFTTVTVGITGSVGKTTTKETVANVLAQRYVTLRSEGNLNNEIGLPLTLLRLTPEHRARRAGDGHVRAGRDRPAVRAGAPRIGVVTNVGPTHLERLGSIERIAQAKSELVQALPPRRRAALPS